MPIRQLPARLANQIAAGEVVERPASVVKELVENSIDAGATELWIDIEQGGARRIRVRDNGSGIAQDELELALSRHATSKISTLDDLESIMSLGFRGEALASISSVSRLTLTSKPAAQSEAWQAFCEGRDMTVAVQPAAHPDGTTVDVEDLFFNTPARRKFMRTEKTEFGHVDEVVRRIALGCPQVRIHLSHNQRKARDYRPASNEKQHLQRLRMVAGRAFSEEALAISNEQAPWALHGWIATADCCRHQGDVQYIYVNGRMMKDKLLNHAIRQAYGETLPADRQPTYVLYLDVPARDVDVNVHPAKHEVRFHQARQVHDFVLHSIRQAMPSANTAEYDTDEGYQPPPRHFYAQPQTSAAADTTPVLSVGSASSSRSSHSPAQVEQAAASAYQALMTPAAAPAEVAQGEWQLLSLLQQRVLLLQQGDALALLEVATLHQQVERARLRKQLAQGLSGQPLLLPVQLSLDHALSDDCKQQLAQLGVQLKPVARERVVVMQVPALLRRSSIEASIPQLLKLLPEDRSIALMQHEPLLDWLSAQAIQDTYGDDEAKYWWQQSVQLQLTPRVRRLDWQAAVSGAPHG
ncbi:DNA mismatch repair endonuclease MutL [Aliidiomarina sp. Khilg15.8]